MHTPFWLIFPSRINWAPIPVGVPTVLAMPLNPFLSPMATSVLFFIVFLPFFSIKKICCMAIRSVSPLFKDNFFSRRLTRFSIKLFEESQIYNYNKKYSGSLLKHLEVFKCFDCVLPFFFLFIFLKIVIEFHLFETPIPDLLL